MANNPPILSGLDTASYTENAAPVKLDTDGNASVSDVELDASANYGGARLTLARQGGTNPDYTFGGNGTAVGQLDLTHSNGSDENVSLDGGATFIGTFSQSGDGTFTIVFNSNASHANVNSVLRQVSYANTNDTPPASVTIDFTFDDGNGLPGGQDQGAGPTPGTTTGSVTVSITPTNDAPRLINVAPSATYVSETSGVVLSSGLGVFDPDPPSPTTAIAGTTIQIASGFLAGDQLFVNLALDGNGHFITPDLDSTNIAIQSSAGGTLTLSGQDSLSHYQSVL